MLIWSNAAVLKKFALLLTWLKEHDGLEAGELGGVNGESLEAAKDLLQEAQVQAGVASFALHTWAEVRQREQGAAVQRQRPLDGTEQEELAPGLLQQDHLGGRGKWCFNSSEKKKAHLFLISDY